MGFSTSEQYTYSSLSAAPRKTTPLEQESHRRGESTDRVP
jgi:hypothetical protein